MPAAPRPEGKAKKIAYKILGTPANMVELRRWRNSKVEKRLEFEETSRAR